MQQGLELERDLAIVSDDEGGVEALLVESDAVQQAKLVRPQALPLVVELLRGQSKVQLDARSRGALARGLAEELPARVAGEAVLGELGGGFAIGGAKNLQREGSGVRRGGNTNG